jgi:hypothetical protein
MRTTLLAAAVLLLARCDDKTSYSPAPVRDGGLRDASGLAAPLSQAISNDDAASAPDASSADATPSRSDSVTT